MKFSPLSAWHQSVTLKYQNVTVAHFTAYCFILINAYSHLPHHRLKSCLHLCSPGHSKMLQTIATIVVVIAVPLLVLVWVKTPTYTSDEPTAVPYTIPVLGNAQGFATYHRKFMDESKYVFSLFLSTAWLLN